MKKRFHYKKLLQYFLQGLLILAPVAITAYSIFWVVSSIDSWLPIFTYIDKNGLVHVRNYGIGFIIIIAALILALVMMFWAGGQVQPFPWLYNHIPLLAQFRFLGRALAIAALWWVLLAGIALDFLWNSLRGYAAVQTTFKPHRHKRSLD